MVSFKALLLGATGALAIPFNAPETSDTGLVARAGTASSTGWSNNYYYSFWTDNGGTVNYQNNAAGSYAVQWTNCGNFVGGKGWYVLCLPALTCRPRGKWDAVVLTFSP